MRYLRCGLLLWLCLCLSACDKHAHEVHATGTDWLKACPDFSVTGKAPVEQNAQCGQLSVRENPADANSPMISLNVLRLPAINPVPAPDPLFVIAGGPGQSAVVLAETVHTLFNDVRKNRDIIFVDQRGTGKSHPFECNLEDAQDEYLTTSEKNTKIQQRVAQCVAKYQGHWGYYTTPYAVADLDAVRAALGYQQINLWGGSYGTRVVLEYLRRYGKHTRTGIMDGVAPAAIALPWYMERDGMAALQSVNAQCAASPACVSAYGDLVEKANQIADALMAKPVAISIQHPRTEAHLNLLLRAEDFSSVVHLALYNRDMSALLPKMISDAAAGNYQLLGSVMYLARARSDMSNINYGMHYAVVCNEDYPLYKDKPAEDSNQFLHMQMVQNYRAICAQIPKAEMPADFWSPVTSDVPVLLLSGAQDPVTPPVWAEQVKQGLSHSMHLVAPGGHHIISAEGCVSQVIAQFIEHGSAEGLDAQCVQQIQPMPMHVPAVAADAAP